MSTEENKAVVRRYVEAFLMEGDFSHADELVTPDFSIDRSAVPEAIAGAEGLSKQMAMLKQAFPDLDLQVADMFAEGDKVAVRFIAPGTHRGEFVGIPATGKKVMWKGIVIYRVENGKVAEAWANWDDVGLMQSIQS